MFEQEMQFRKLVRMMRLALLRLYAGLIVLPPVRRLENPKTIEQIQREVSRIRNRIRFAYWCFAGPLPDVFATASRLACDMQAWLDEQEDNHKPKEKP